MFLRRLTQAGICCLFWAATALAQAHTDAPASEMNKLNFLVGQWQGVGWLEFGPGQRRSFTIAESVQAKVGGRVLVVEGLGKSKAPDSNEELTVHQAFAVVSYDEQAKVFRWRAFRVGGGWLEDEPVVTEKSLAWKMNDPRAGQIRFTIKLNDKGEWFEIGEMSRDGQTWRQFFEMTLQRAGQRTGAPPANMAAPPEVKALVGTYTGSWTLFGIDEQGQAVKRFSWTDTLKAENPTVKGERAYVATLDEMTFAGGQIPPQKISGVEGYLLNQDGTLGAYFIETAGQTYHLQKLSQNVWSYAAPVTPQELTMLGFRNVSSAQHVLVKIVTVEGGKETHRISRTTTVNWKDAEGRERTAQFVSLQGFHQRQTP